MRALYNPNLNDYKSGDEILVTGDSFHHLKNVIRIKEKDSLLFLNGRGNSGVSEILEISKKEIRASLKTHEFHEDQRNISLVIGVPKKEALESILRIAVELNLKNIYLYYSKYAQYKVEYTPRYEKILVSALEQSNGIYLPQVKAYSSERFDDFQKVLMTNRLRVNKEIMLTSDKEIVYFVGPEAGFSDEEERELKKGAYQVMLPSNILRAPTAVAAGAGFITARLAGA